MIGSKTTSAFCNQCVQTIKETLILPNSLKDTCEEFDPCLMTMDVVEQHIPRLIIDILEFRGDDQTFSTMISE